MSVLSDGAPAPALSAGSAITTGRSLKATPSATPAATSSAGGWVLPRSATSSSPSRVASASALFLSPSAMTSTRVPTSATSP